MCVYETHIVKCVCRSKKTCMEFIKIPLHVKCNNSCLPQYIILHVILRIAGLCSYIKTLNENYSSYLLFPHPTPLKNWSLNWLPWLEESTTTIAVVPWIHDLLRPLISCWVGAGLKFSHSPLRHSHFTQFSKMGVPSPLRPSNLQMP